MKNTQVFRLTTQWLQNINFDNLIYDPNLSITEHRHNATGDWLAGQTPTSPPCCQRQVSKSFSTVDKDCASFGIKSSNNGITWIWTLSLIKLFFVLHPLFFCFGKETLRYQAAKQWQYKSVFEIPCRILGFFFLIVGFHRRRGGWKKVWCNWCNPNRLAVWHTVHSN